MKKKEEKLGGRLEIYRLHQCPGNSRGLLLVQKDLVVEGQSHHSSARDIANPNPMHVLRRYIILM